MTTLPPDLGPVDPNRTLGRGDGQQRKQNAATGASAAGIRALTTQFLTYYFRAPIKAFFRTRVDYTAYARAINPQIKANTGWSWRTTTPGLLAHAVKQYGWSFIPNQVLPPMLANVTVGAVLYTAYLQTLGAFHAPSAENAKRVYPPAPPSHTFLAGFTAGSIQSLIAAPLDALQVRFRTADMLEGRYRTMWHYASAKLHSIGVRGIFAGYGLSLVRDAFGSGVFFATFEYIKSQGYYNFVTRYYGHFEPVYLFHPYKSTISYNEDQRATIRPHYALEPSFLLLAGVAASVAQQGILYPLNEIQNVHYGRLESIDYAAKLEPPSGKMMRLYYHAYQETFKQCERQAKRAGGWRRYLYRNFWASTARQVPSTSAGLIVFELVRRKYGGQGDEVRISRDGYDILLR
ncbi:hypothetical protein W97_05628 [Coniosporium apollinis CBS 100218]|uniref:Mitochondrial carrier protein n=1 Tax=Coniosporium apollinis (strain CBS 100218) TaxID=1168221 RepID=R7YWC0_CONA1|nr:uncharacterized protein W97_05628 [Coniosporium apollinis CBS 100218]EON66235.1 hypothetical protein W97_05628 [Coniosporium apollinis CBS 100218]